MLRMFRRSCCVLLLVLCAGSLSAQRSVPLSVSPQDLGRIWDAEHVSPPLPALMTHAEVAKRLDAVVQSAPSLFRLEKIGESVESRSINMVTAGTGPFPVL